MPAGFADKSASSTTVGTAAPLSEVPAPPPRLEDELFFHERDLATPAPAISSVWLRRAAWATIAVLVCVGLGVRAQSEGRELRGEVTSSVKVAEQALHGAKDNLTGGNYAAAAAQFTIARDAMHRANVQLADRGQLASPSVTRASGNLTAGTQLLSSAELLAASGVDLSGDLAGMREDLTARQNDLFKSGEVVAGRVPALQKHLRETEQRLKLLSYTLADSRTGLSGEVKSAADRLNSALPEMTDSVHRANQVADALPALLGTDHFRQYVVWFQNPAELRPTGGFVGTYGKVTLDNGSLRDLLVESIYNPANQVNSTITDIGPAPYARFLGDNQPAPPWALQNANWSPNFPTSAQTFQKYYEKSGGPTTDGVIAINTIPIINILRVTGPIEMPEYNYTLGADNFQQTIQADQYAKSLVGDQDPKKILRDFMPKLLARIGQAGSEQQKQIGLIMANAVKQRDLTMYFNDRQLERLAADIGAGGTLSTGSNTLAMVDTNIAGLKSSTDVTSNLSRDIRIDKSGRVTTELVLERRFTGPSLDINKNYTRFFLPKGSKDIKTEGFSDYGPVTTDEQDGFTVVAGWTDVNPGGSRTSKVSYQLPKPIDIGDGELPVLYQKQSGTAVTVSTSVTLPDGYQWRDPGSGRVDGGTLRLTDTATTDLTYRLTFKKR